MIKDARLKNKIKESITNLSSIDIIPSDEVQLNLDVIYNSILNEICSIVPMNSPRQIISCLKLNYGTKNKSLIEINDIEKDAFKLLQMNGVGAVPLNDEGYPTNKVRCNVILGKDSNLFIAPYSNIIPGTVKLTNTEQNIDASDSVDYGKITDTQSGKTYEIDYEKGIIHFDTSLPSDTILEYEFDLYSILNNRNITQFNKTFVEVFADLYQLDIDSALCLNDFKGLDLHKNIENIIPQILAQQIDQYICSKYFKQAENNKNLRIWNSEADWEGKTRVPVTLLYEDFGTYISSVMSDFIIEHGVLPNVIICNPKSYGILSINKKFIPENTKEELGTGTPKLVGYYNNSKVILINNIQSDVDVVLTYKGQADAQAAGVYTPFIPITTRNVIGMESNGMITTNNVYSIAGFAMINPELVSGIIIK